MKVTPKTEKEIAEANLIPAGEYDAEILYAEDTTSKKSSAEMIKVQLKVYGPTGAPVLIFDYLLDAMPAKIRHCAEACGVLDRYEAGELNGADIQGAAVRVKVEVQHNETGQYPDKNGIKDYVVSKQPAKKESAASRILNAKPMPQTVPSDDAMPSDSDIPF